MVYKDLYLPISGIKQDCSAIFFPVLLTLYRNSVSNNGHGEMEVVKPCFPCNAFN